MSDALVSRVEITVLNHNADKPNLYYTFSPTQPVVLAGPVERVLFERGIAEATAAIFAIDMFDVDVVVHTQATREVT